MCQGKCESCKREDLEDAAPVLTPYQMQLKLLDYLERLLPPAPDPELVQRQIEHNERAAARAEEHLVLLRRSVEASEENLRIMRLLTEILWARL